MPLWIIAVLPSHVNIYDYMCILSEGDMFRKTNDNALYIITVRMFDILFT